jgi:hypothetical protein
MRLGIRPLEDVQTVNSFEYVDELEWTEGDALYVHFQLVDLNLDRSDQGFRPAGRRYVPAAGAFLTAVVESIDDAKTVTRLCVQPFPLDASIWRLQILSTDRIRGTPQLKLTLNEGGVITRGVAKFVIKIHPKDNL